MLRDSESLDEQGDILHFLVVEKGLDYTTGKMEDGSAIRVKDLLKDLYEKACRQKNWGLVRHTAGMLGKRVEDLAKAVTDLLVHQKQVTVGMPPYNERTITAPLPNSDLRHLIHQVIQLFNPNIEIRSVLLKKQFNYTFYLGVWRG